MDHFQVAQIKFLTTKCEIYPFNMLGSKQQPKYIDALRDNLFDYLRRRFFTKKQRKRKLQVLAEKEITVEDFATEIVSGNTETGNTSKANITKI